MLHLWLIPALALLVAVVGAFYYAMHLKGGSGIRNDGRTVLDKPIAEEDMPPN